jgi:hypothetical protein
VTFSQQHRIALDVTQKPSDVCKPAENVYTNFFGTIPLTMNVASRFCMIAVSSNGCSTSRTALGVGVENKLFIAN